MEISKKNLMKLLELEDVLFEHRFLEIDCYREKSMLFGGNSCFEATKSFDLGLLKDFEIKGLKAKVEGITVRKIQEYAKGKSYDREESNSGRMNITLVYVVKKGDQKFYVACETTIIFPMLIRHVVDFVSGFDKILLFPYIKYVRVYGDNNFRELMNHRSLVKDNVLSNNDTYIDEKLYKDALFMLELFNLTGEDKRCLMNIHDDTFPSRCTITLHDLYFMNVIGMYRIRPYLEK